MRAPLPAALLLLALTTSTRAQASECSAYSGDALIQLRNPGLAGLATEVPLDLSTSRALAFADAGLDLSALRLIVGGGCQAGRNQNLSTRFEKLDASKGKLFAGLGLRLGW